jgi:anti-sigma28 factor (negative regulator of flagellin synthesis)
MDIRSVPPAYGTRQFDSVARSDKRAAPEKRPTAQSEQVEISEESIKLQRLSMEKLNEIIDKTPDVRLKVVEEIKMKIKYNGYPIESNMYKAIANLVEKHII